MTLLNDEKVREYLDPVFGSILDNLIGFEQRRLRRPVVNWTANDFMMTAAEARQLYEDCQWIVDALDIIRDARNGEFDAKDREGGTPG